MIFLTIFSNFFLRIFNSFWPIFDDQMDLMKMMFPSKSTQFIFCNFSLWFSFRRSIKFIHFCLKGRLKGDNFSLKSYKGDLFEFWKQADCRYNTARRSHLKYVPNTSYSILRSRDMTFNESPAHTQDTVKESTRLSQVYLCRIHHDWRQYRWLDNR